MLSDQQLADATARLNVQFGLDHDGWVIVGLVGGDERSGQGGQVVMSHTGHLIGITFETGLMVRWEAVRYIKAPTATPTHKP